MRLTFNLRAMPRRHKLAPVSTGPINMAGIPEVGYWSLFTGAAIGNLSWWRLPAISIEGGRDVFFQHQGNRRDIMWLDGSGVFIQRNSPYDLDTGVTLAAPANAAVVKINLAKSLTGYDPLTDDIVVRYA